jgi:hypothetical protein
MSQIIFVLEERPDQMQLLKRAFGQARIELPVYFCGCCKEAICYLAGESRFCDREAFPPPCLFVLPASLISYKTSEFIQEIRRNPAFREVPLALLTASRLHPQAKAAKELGAEVFVRPSSLRETRDLATMLRELCNKSLQTA